MTKKDLNVENVDFGESEDEKKRKEETKKKYEDFGKFVQEVVGSELTGVSFFHVFLNLIQPCQLHIKQANKMSIKTIPIVLSC